MPHLFNREPGSRFKSRCCQEAIQTLQEFAISERHCFVKVFFGDGFRDCLGLWDASEWQGLVHQK